MQNAVRHAVCQEARGFVLIISGFAELQAFVRASYSMKSMPYDDEVDAGEPGTFKPLTAEEARGLREQNPSVPPGGWWRGRSVVGVRGGLWPHGRSPGGKKRWLVGRLRRSGSGHLPAAAVCAGPDRAFCLAECGDRGGRVFLWEMVKLALTVAMLIAAPRLVVCAELAGIAGRPGAHDEGVLGCAMAFAPKRANVAKQQTSNQMATEHGPTAGEYIVHHLTHLQNKTPKGVADFSVFNLDSLFFSIVLGVLGCWLLWLAARKATSGVPGRFQAAVEILVEMVDTQAKGIVHNANSRKLVAPLALVVFVWIFLMNAMDLLPVDLLPGHLGQADLRRWA
jgi:hypothetical protein